MKRERTARRYDPNVHLAYEAGAVARLGNKPETACPNLTVRFGEVYGTELADAWMRGWHDQNRAMQPTLPGVEP